MTPYNENFTHFYILSEKQAAKANILILLARIIDLVLYLSGKYNTCRVSARRNIASVVSYWHGK